MRPKNVQNQERLPVDNSGAAFSDRDAKYSVHQESEEYECDIWRGIRETDASWTWRSKDKKIKYEYNLTWMREKVVLKISERARGLQRRPVRHSSFSSPISFTRLLSTMSTSGLKAIAPVPTAADFLDIVLSKTQRKTPTVRIYSRSLKTTPGGLTM